MEPEDTQRVSMNAFQSYMCACVISVSLAKCQNKVSADE